MFGFIFKHGYQQLLYMCFHHGDNDDDHDEN